MFLNIIYHYSYQHSRFRYLRQTFQPIFINLRNVPLPFKKFITSVYLLVSIHHRCKILHSMSYNALFKGWLLLSLPFEYHQFFTSYALTNNLKTLVNNLGCSPLDFGPQHPKSICQNIYFVIRSLIKLGKIKIPLIYSELYLQNNFLTIYLNIFRGKPAISEFDWPFTPNQKSSPPFSTDVGSVLIILFNI